MGKNKVLVNLHIQMEGSMKESGSIINLMELDFLHFQIPKREDQEFGTMENILSNFLF